MFFGHHHRMHRMKMRFGHGAHHEGHFGGGRGRGGARRRMFDGAALRLILLSLIEQQPRHGYELIREIEELSGGVYAPSPGVVYPTLTMLSEMGLIEEVVAEGAANSSALRRRAARTLPKITPPSNNCLNGSGGLAQTAKVPITRRLPARSKISTACCATAFHAKAPA